MFLRRFRCLAIVMIGLCFQISNGGDLQSNSSQNRMPTIKMQEARTALNDMIVGDKFMSNAQGFDATAGPNHSGEQEIFGA